jgi:hypothetical protein
MSQDAWDVVLHAYEMGGFTTRSDYARANMEGVAAAACMGLLTTELPRGGYGSVWRPSARGVRKAFEREPAILN